MRGLRLIRPRGRPKGRKDSGKRIRGVDKLHKDPLAYKAIKKYLEEEKNYNRLKKLRDTTKHGSQQRKFYVNQMRAVRVVQADLYETIAENYLVVKLCTELGVGVNKPYRRWKRARERQEKERKKQNGN